MPISSSLAAPLVVVVGSTGNQGGSVIQALADSDRPYRIRGITRDVTKPAAQKLSSQGVEMMNLSLTVENANAVRAAFAEADIVFEAAEGKMMVDAAKAADVKLLVWSALEPWWYMTNHMLFNGFIPTKEPDGSYALALSVGPDTVLHVIDALHDYGLFVREGIESPAFGPGKEVLAAAEGITVKEIAAQLSQITGKKVVYKQISDEEFMAATKAPPRIALEFLEMMKYFEEFGYFADKDAKSIRQHLSRAPRTWADFVRANDWSSVFV
ncbi:NAD(P)-binding protein [Mycena leptocephala]|nr:NAD(P)-binding protein [Mycena leptocephala]